MCSFKHIRVEKLPKNIVWREWEKNPYYVFKQMMESNFLVVAVRSTRSGPVAAVTDESGTKFHQDHYAR